MSDKILIIIFGAEDSSQKDLTAKLLGKDSSALCLRKTKSTFARQTAKKFKRYEDDTYEVACVGKSNKAYTETKRLLKKRHPDVCFLMLEDEVSTDKVWKQIDEAHKKTGIHRELFKVVLPLGYKDTVPSSSLFKLYTMEEVCSQMTQLTEERKQTPTRKRKSDNSESHSHQESNSGSKKPKEQRVNLVLLGMSGTGKSASGNTILKKNHFTSRASSNQVTTECQLVEAEINGRPVRVIDTPDIFDDDIKSSDKDKHVKRCDELCRSDPRVYLLVMQVSRFTDAERDVLKKLEKAFGGRAREQTIILFTCGEELQRAEMTLEEFLKSCQPDLKKIVDMCDNRCVTFENKASGSDQVEKLMQEVSRVLETLRK